MDRVAPPARSAEPVDESAVLGFSHFTLDLRGGRLTRAGSAIPLRPKTWAVLVHLARRPGALVTRDELLDAVWPDVAVTLDTLTKSIGELRGALGDDPRRPRFIETVHCRGFRFLDTPRPLPGAGADTAAAPARGVRPFVGREAELQRLTECFERACAGQRQVVFVCGPAGVGKTSLVDGFLESDPLRGRAARVGRGASIGQHGPREAYMPLLEALERLARGADGEALVTTLRATAPSWLVQMPWLAADDPTLLQRALQTARPERMLRECVALLEALAADAPLVLALEDLHWSDPSTVDLLARIGQRREPARLLIIATYRQAEVAVHEHPLASAVRMLRAQRRCVELPLHELSAAAVQRYLETRLPGAAIPPTLAAILHAHTDGNPLFVRAIVDHMAARGWILDTAPGWSFDAMPAQPEFGVPDDVRDMVALQVDSLAPVDRRLLEAAAVVGRSSTAATLAAVLERPVEDVEIGCEALARGERFLCPSADAPARYVFAHELYRQAVYREIPPGRRRRLHGRIGEVFEGQAQQHAADLAPQLAHHFEQGGDADRALHYLAQAAAQARQRAAPRAASEYLEHGLALVARLPETAERARHELDLRVALAPVLIERFGPASRALRENCTRALALCGRAENPPLHFHILNALCHVHCMRGDAAAFDAVCAALDELAGELGDAEHRLVAGSIHCRTDFYRARYGEACRQAEAVFAIAATGAPPAPTAFGADPLIGTLTHHALGLWMLGHVQRSRDAMRAAGGAAPGAAPFTNASVLVLDAALAMLERDPERVLATAAAALPLSQEHEFTHWTLVTTALQDWARLQLGDPQAAVDGLRQTRDAYARTEARVFSTYILAFLAEAYLRTGDVAAGLDAVDEALRIADATLDRSYVPELWRLKGELLLARAGGRRDDGESCLQRAIALARASEARSLQLRAAASLARLWMASGRNEAARALLADAVAGVDATVETRDLRDARQLLAEPASTRSRRAARSPRRRARPPLDG